MPSDLEKRLLDVCGTCHPLALLLSGGDVRRYHQEGHTYAQPVSEHTFRVLIILLYFWPNANRNLILSTLYHDTPERLTGDTPATVKINNPDIKAALDREEIMFLRYLQLPCEHDLPAEELAQLKCCDYLELTITCKYQHGRRAQQIYDRGRDLVRSHAERLSSADRDRVLHFLSDIEEGHWQA